MSDTVIESVDLIAARHRFIALIRQQADHAPIAAYQSPRVDKHPLRHLFDETLQLPMRRRISFLLPPLLWHTGIGPFPAAHSADIVRDAAVSLAQLRSDRTNEHEVWLANLVVFAPTPFFAVNASDNPEPIWYAELLMLHLFASYTWQFGDARMFDALAARARHYQATTQPDHATNEPWAVHAFAVDPTTHFTADQILHASEMNAVGTGPHAVALMALRDALYSLEQYRPDSAKGSHD